jgi:hypothetical protein
MDISGSNARTTYSRFCVGQVYWNCKMDSWREDATCESPIASIYADETSSPWYHALQPGACRTQAYCANVNKFSGRDFKEPRDVLWAFFSVLRMQESQFPQGFIWGLPYEQLDVALLWRESEACPNEHTRHARHVVVRGDSFSYLRYPSWSWLSTKAKVNFIHSCEYSVVPEVSWREPLQIEGSDDFCGTNIDQQTDISAAMFVSGKVSWSTGFCNSQPRRQSCVSEER